MNAISKIIVGVCIAWSQTLGKCVSTCPKRVSSTVHSWHYWTFFTFPAVLRCALSGIADAPPTAPERATASGVRAVLLGDQDSVLVLADEADSRVGDVLAHLCQASDCLSLETSCEEIAYLTSSRQCWTVSDFLYAVLEANIFSEDRHGGWSRRDETVRFIIYHKSSLVAVSSMHKIDILLPQCHPSCQMGWRQRRNQ